MCHTMSQMLRDCQVTPTGNSTSTRIETHPPLGELVDALLGGGTSGLDHVQDALLVRHEAGHFAYYLPHHLDALAQSLWGNRAERVKKKRVRQLQVIMDKTRGT